MGNIRIQEVILEDNAKRDVFIDSNGFPVLPVMKYLKYLVMAGKSSNTQKTYCYSLKHYLNRLH